MKFKTLFHNATLTQIQKHYDTYERHISAVAVISGFTIDNLTLTRIDLTLDNVILLSYLAVALAGITLTNLYVSGKLRAPFFEKICWLFPISLQFSFGGVFSGFFVFYSRSASLAASWPFLLFLLLLLVGNEFFREQYKRLTFQLSIFYVALLSYLIFFIPIVVKGMGALVFLFSGLVSLIVITLVVQGLESVLPGRIRQSRRGLAWSIAGIFIAMNVLYFTNILPPIPLSLKDAQVAHAVERRGSEYVIVREEARWYDVFDPRDEIHVGANDPVSFFSSVFAPTDIDTDITHVWQYKRGDEWVTATRITFPIVGGRDGGYRGWSTKRNIFPGTWRVAVQNDRGQQLGRVTFEVKHGGGKDRETIIR